MVDFICLLLESNPEKRVDFKGCFLIYAFD